MIAYCTKMFNIFLATGNKISRCLCFDMKVAGLFPHFHLFVVTANLKLKLDANSPASWPSKGDATPR